MKFSSVIKTFAVAVALLAAPAAFGQFLGIGPAISGSVEATQLPSKAHKFIEKYLPGGSVATVEKEFADGDYDVKMSDGTSMEFGAKGDLKEIEAPEGSALRSELVKGLVPKNVYKKLVEQNVNGCVASIELKDKKYHFEFVHPTVDKIIILGDGTVVAIEYED